MNLNMTVIRISNTNVFLIKRPKISNRTSSTVLVISIKIRRIIKKGRVIRQNVCILERRKC